MALDARIRCNRCVFRNSPAHRKWQAVLQTRSFFMPARFGPLLFGFILSALMSGIVSGVATFRHTGLADGFLDAWVGAWLASWLVAFPVVLLAAPIARRLVGLMVKAPSEPARRS
jgi:hypothetical protein